MKTKFSKSRRNKKLMSAVFGIMAFALTGMYLCAPVPLSDTNKSASAQSAPSSSALQYDSAFMYAPTSSVTFPSGITVTLDSSSGNLLTLSDGKILQGANSSYSALSATDLFSLGNNIVLINKSQVSSASTKIIVLDAETKTKKDVEFAGDTSPLLSAFTHVSATSVDGALHILFYSDNFSFGAVYVVLEDHDGELMASAPRQISFNFTDPTGTTNSSTFESLNLCFDTSLNLPYAVASTSEKFFVFYIQNGSDKVSNITFEGNQFSAPSGASVHTFVFSGTNYMMIQNGSALSVHSYTLSSSEFDVATSPASSKTIELSTIDSVSLTGSTLTLTSTADQKVVVTSIGLESNSLVFGESRYTTNPEVTISYFDAGSIGFAETTNSDNGTALRATPFSGTTLATIRPQSNIVHIGSGYMTYDGETPQKINGYEYYMFTDSNGNNFYGFAKIDEVTDTITPETEERTFVYARGGSKIFKYPSRTVTANASDINELIYTTTDLTRLEVKRDISAFYYSSGNGNNYFYEVEINGTVGYIQDINVDKTQGGTLVQTNAVVLRTSVIYTNPNVDTNNTIFTLNEATRVRIIENRNGNEKYTKISFNDDNGNYYIGYILSENIKADSWTSMQLIGLTLVVFSIILLGVILIVKNKINHE